MKIAQIASIFETIPPKLYGGTERIVSVLTEELVRRGHDVTLFASASAVTSAKLISTFPTSLREVYPDDNNPSDVEIRTMKFLEHLGNAYRFQDDFDIIHDHTGFYGIPFAQSCQTPVVATLHGPISQARASVYQTLSKPYIVTISQSQARTAPQLNHIATIYNGLEMNDYPFSPRHDGYLLAVGRFIPEKGIHNAITIAERLHLPLLIAAKLDAGSKDYFNQMIRPRLSDTIRWVGEIDEKERNKIMSRAMCFLHPLEWEEPFGLTIIEAMACGAPVVAYNRGSMSEIISNGKTGFVTSGLEESVEKIKQIQTIDRAYCRSYVLEKFNAKRMTSDYERIYDSIRASQMPYPWLYQPSTQLEYSDIN